MNSAICNTWLDKLSTQSAAQTSEEQQFFAEILLDIEVRFTSSIAQLNVPFLGEMGPFQVDIQQLLPMFVANAFVEFGVAQVLAPEWMTAQALKAAIEAETASAELQPPPHEYAFEYVAALKKNFPHVRFRDEAGGAAANLHFSGLRRQFELWAALRMDKIDAINYQLLKNLCAVTTNFAAGERRLLILNAAKYLKALDPAVNPMPTPLPQLVETTFDVAKQYEEHKNWLEKIKSEIH